MNVATRTAAIVLAGGSGKRMQSDVKKQYMEIQGRPLVYYSLAAFEKSEIEKVVLVCSPGDEEYCRREIVEKYGLKKVVRVVPGGKERYHSVYEGLKALEETDYVLIHDGARPFLTEDVIARALDGAVRYGACVVGMPSKDTVKLADEDGFVADTPKRSLTWNVQTPQAFRYSLVFEAYAKVLASGEIASITDDAMMVERATSARVKLVEGSYGNIKITTPEDLKGIEEYSF